MQRHIKCDRQSKEKTVNRNRTSGILDLTDKDFNITMINMLKVDLVGKMVQNFRRDIETVKRNRDH